MNYQVHTIKTGPAAAQPVLEQVRQTSGVIPNIAGAMSNSPELLRAFFNLFTQVHSGTFNQAEIQTLLLTNAVTNASGWAVAFHTMLALKQGLTPGDVEAIRTRGVPDDTHLAALSALARKLIETRGHVTEHELASFIDAGFTREQTLEILAVTAASTITNYVGTITQTPLEEFLRPYAWESHKAA